MSAPLLLRGAAVLALIQYAAHTALFLRARPSHGQEEIDVVESMKSHRWPVAGRLRGYWDFYFGYGLLAILYGLVEIALLWSLAGVAGVTSVAAMIAILLIANLAHAVLTLRYFFPLPAILDAFVAIPLILALIR